MVTARSLYDKSMSVGFVLSMMFVKNVVPKTKQMTEALQAEELNIVDGLLIILRDPTKTLMPWMPKFTVVCVFTLVRRCPEAEFNRKHRVRNHQKGSMIIPIGISDANNVQFYR